jgi:membrane-associated protease RseP (regulator of RpoE activity)
MSSKSLSLTFVFSLAFAVSGVARADDKPAPAPTPPPADKPAETPGEKPTEKPSEKPAERGYIGFIPAPAAALSPKQREHWNVKSTTGVVGVRIVKGSPADVAGFRNGDVILKYNGHDAPSTKDLDVKDPQKVQAFQIAFGALASAVKVGGVVEIVVERDGKPVTLKATAIGMEAMQKISAAAGEDEDGEDEEDEEGDEGDEKAEGKEKPAKTTPDKPATPPKDSPK